MNRQVAFVFTETINCIDKTFSALNNQLVVILVDSNGLHEFVKDRKQIFAEQCMLFLTASIFVIFHVIPFSKETLRAARLIWGK